MRGLRGGIFLISLVTLSTELVLTRVLDVLFYANMAYLVVTSAIFGFGLAGAATAVWKKALQRDPHTILPGIAVIFAVSLLLIRPMLNLFPFDYYDLPHNPRLQTFYFGMTYLALLLPFVASGLIISILFATRAPHIRRLYFWDLAGAALGAVLFIPLMRPLGPGSILILGAAAALVAAALMSQGRRWRVATGVAAVALALVPALHYPDYFRFSEHLDKRGVRTAREQGRVELTRWDPVARIDIIDLEPGRKHVAYDGGTQSSHFLEFDGDFDRLGRRLRSLDADSVTERRFWRVGVLASHYLKRDTDADVLVIGSAGGQETLAALAFGARSVDAVEMVPTVVDLRVGEYADYIGHLFEQPGVSNILAEGRSYLRATDRTYDIIQIFSNHTSSSAAAGSRAMSPFYLQTAGAYREYVQKLAPNGILHVNQHVYPRVITTAALAWRQLGRTDFRDHVVVYARDGVDNLPSILIKEQPWTAAELRQLDALFTMRFMEMRERRVEDPLRPEASFLSDAFYSGDFPDSLAQAIPYHVTAVTDDQPFFNAIRKSIRWVQPDSSVFFDVSTAEIVNGSLAGGRIPMDWIQFFGVGILSVIFATLLVVIPLRFSTAGRGAWEGRTAALTYFSCLGLGFIIIEIVLIQVFMRLIGSPAHAFSAVIFTLLLAAGTGSAASELLGIGQRRSWVIPFAGIVGFGAITAFVFPALFEPMMGLPLSVRVLAAALLLYPLGFFLGMPFPLGILALEGQPRSAVAWAWGVNGLFTVVGGLVAALLSLAVGFSATLGFALLVYVGAMTAYWGMSRRQVTLPGPAEAKRSPDADPRVFLQPAISER
jgi:spermidine synthase